MIFRAIVIVILLILLLICFVFTIYYFIDRYLAAPYVPASRKKVKRVLDAVDLQASDKVCDLGSGDGRMVFGCAKRGVKEAVGYEINPALFLYSYIKSKVKRAKNTKFYIKSLWNVDLREYDKVFIYLMPKSLPRLEKKFQKEMQEGTQIISLSFTLPNMKPVKDDGVVRVYEI